MSLSSSSQDKDSVPSAAAQQYFQTRIAAARQRALLASIQTSDKAALDVLGHNNHKSTPAATPVPITTSTPVTPAVKQDYFATRIALSRQRALLANIVSATDDKLTMATLQGLTRAAVQVPFVSPAVAITQRLQAQRQQALLEQIASAAQQRTSSQTSSTLWSATKPASAKHTAAPPPVVPALTPEEWQRQQYFAQRIALTRQRALLDNIASSRGHTAVSLVRLDSKVAPPPVATTTPTIRPYYANHIVAPAPASKQNYFAGRIQQSRQRVLLANIAATKATQTQTALSPPARAAAAVAAAAKPVVTNAAEYQNFFAQRMHDVRQGVLLAKIQSTKASQTLSSLPRSSSAVDPVQTQKEYFRKRIEQSRQQTNERNMVYKTPHVPNKPAVPPQAAPKAVASVPPKAIAPPKATTPVAPRVVSNPNVPKAVIPPKAATPIPPRAVPNPIISCHSTKGGDTYSS